MYFSYDLKRNVIHVLCSTKKVIINEVYRDSLPTDIEFSATYYLVSYILNHFSYFKFEELRNSLINKYSCFLAYCLQSFALQGLFKQVLITQI